MKITFFEVKEWEKEIISDKLRGNEIAFYSNALHSDDVDNIKDCDILSVFIYSKVTREMIGRLPNLKMIVTRSTGFDHIDVNAAKERGIIVTNIPSYGENTVAEHTFALMLNLSRNVHKSYMRTIKNDFSIDGLEGFDLKGKTIGVIGAGNIGLHVIKIAKGFGMNVLAYDTRKNSFIAEVLGFSYVELDTLLSTSDIISIHAPLNEHTFHLLNKDNIRLIKRGAILINTSRGSLIENEALMQALDEGIIGGAGLDVIEGEELIKEEKQLLHSPTDPEKLKKVLTDYLVFKRENVVFTPHNAFNSREAKQRIIYTTLENISSFIAGNSKNAI